MEGIESQVAVVEECVATFRGLVSAVSDADPSAIALEGQGLPAGVDGPGYGP